MARRTRHPEPGTLSPNALVASAARLDLTRKPRKVIQEDWQREAWEHYDTCGELRYAAQWMGNSLSRALIYPADVGLDGRPAATPTEDPSALAAAYDLLGGPSNQAQILAQVGVHLMIAGDCYIIGETPEDELGQAAPDDEWYVASTEELTYQSGWKIDRGNGKRDLDPDRTVIIRVWSSHPRRKWQADSPTRAVLPILRELAALVRVAGQQMDSRLAGAGLLILPTEVQFPAPSADAVAANPGADPLMLSLAESILTPLDNPDDSSRLVPMTLRVPTDAVDKVRLVSFASQLQGENQAARTACIRRLALGLDMPPEQLLGMGDANHWGAWAIEESGVKLHIAPKLTTIVNAINEGYYVPALERLGLDPFRFTLWFDVSALTQRPNHAEDAKALHAVTELSGDSLRQAAGFGDDDKPSLDERVARLLETVAVANPEAVPDLLPALRHLWGGGTAATMPAVTITVPATPAGDTPVDGQPGADDTRTTPTTDPASAALEAA